MVNKKLDQEGEMIPSAQDLVEKDSMKSLLAKVDALEKRDVENQEKLKMLYETADKGRIFNYENRNNDKKPMKVKLGVHDGKLVVGWRTVRDELIKNPTTGMTVGEVQEIELLLLDKENQTSKKLIDGYVNFSNARYDERMECEVVGKEEKWDGTVTFHLQLPDGRKLSIDGRFIN